MCILEAARLLAADFTEADLTELHLANQDLSGCTFVKSNLSGLDLSDTRLSAADLTGAKLYNVSSFTRTDFSRAKMDGVEIVHTRDVAEPFELALDARLNFLARAELANPESAEKLQKAAFASVIEIAKGRQNRDRILDIAHDNPYFSAVEGLKGALNVTFKFLTGHTFFESKQQEDLKAAKAPKTPVITMRGPGEK